MDPVSHGLAGALVAAASGHELSVTDPLFLGSVIGSLIPDSDIILQLKGDICYLKYHRGFSHSIPGIAFLSLVVAAILFYLLPGNFMEIFLWTLAGAFSHIALDVLNSYGAKILWPLSNKKIGIGILTVFDPVLVILMAITVLIYSFYGYYYLFFGFYAIGIYLILRYAISCVVRKMLFKIYGKNVRVVVSPSVVSIWDWQFFVESDRDVTVGEFRILLWKPIIRKSFKKQLNHPVIDAALNSRLGKWFREFTPFFHVLYHPRKEGHEVKFIDLRYFFKGEFLHSATVFLNEQHKFIRGLFHPYSKNRNIEVLDSTGQ